MLLRFYLSSHLLRLTYNWVALKKLTSLKLDEKSLKYATSMNLQKIKKLNHDTCSCSYFILSLNSCKIVKCCELNVIENKNLNRLNHNAQSLYINGIFWIYSLIPILYCNRSVLFLLHTFFTYVSAWIINRLTYLLYFKTHFLQ